MMWRFFCPALFEVCAPYNVVKNQKWCCICRLGIPTSFDFASRLRKCRRKFLIFLANKNASYGEKLRISASKILRKFRLIYFRLRVGEGVVRIENGAVFVALAFLLRETGRYPVVESKILPISTQITNPQHPYTFLYNFLFDAQHIL